ncbi:MAG TPA: response regulator [Spirochaetota bacterium]|nr:response regulator [Spirochaetota bacterium]
MENHKKRLMLVEDSVVDLRYLQVLLEEMGYVVACTAMSGENAIDLAMAERPDLIVMDILLEGEISGIEAAAKIRKKLDVPVVFATALSDRQTLDGIPIDDLYGYLIKPYNKKNLFASIEIAFKRSEYEKERIELNGQLEQKVIDLKAANEIITLSEEKYRVLVEGSEDIIFSLDGKWNFLTANASMKRHLNYPLERIQRMNFMDIVYGDDESTTRQMVQEILRQFSEGRKTVQFKAEFKCLYRSEPIELQVKLEYLNSEDRNEVLGKASRMTEDALLNHFVGEKQQYEIGNYLITAEEVSFRITRNLVRYMDAREVNNLRIALREIIINSIEHGNLNISFEEKSDALVSDRYFSFLSQRQKDEKYASRKVFIEYEADSSGVQYFIRDQGDGFDYRSIVEMQGVTADGRIIPHGRGILMAQDIFDSIEYNEKGNEVTLVKKFSAG